MNYFEFQFKMMFWRWNWWQLFFFLKKQNVLFLDDTPRPPPPPPPPQPRDLVGIKLVLGICFDEKKSNLFEFSVTQNENAFFFSRISKQNNSTHRGRSRKVGQIKTYRFQHQEQAGKATTKNPAISGANLFWWWNVGIWWYFWKGTVLIFHCSRFVGNFLDIIGICKSSLGKTY